MITEVRMPKLGMAMKKGAVTKWLRAEGDTVAEGADLFELATEKITAVVPSPASGLLGVPPPVAPRGAPGGGVGGGGGGVCPAAAGAGAGAGGGGAPAAAGQV